MTAYQHRPHLHEPEHTPEPGGDWRNALIAACGTVAVLGALVGLYEVAAWVRGWF